MAAKVQQKNDIRKHACHFRGFFAFYSMFALIPRSGYYSGASLGVRFIALLHPI